MKGLMVGLLGLVLSVAALNAKDDPPKTEPPAQPQALPPHPLDGAFARGNTPNDLTNGLLNNDLFKKAVAAAAKAKAETIAARRQNPNVGGPTPEQAARKKFLDMLNEGK
jgi:hypothetical protein